MGQSGVLQKVACLSTHAAKRSGATIWLSLIILLGGPELRAEHASSNDYDTSAAEVFREPTSPIPPAVASNDPRIDLGRQLFFDARFSATGDRACASCHVLPALDPAHPTPVKQPQSIPHVRDLNLLYNLAYAYWYNWDGRYLSLNNLIADAIQAPDKLGLNRQQAEAYLAQNPSYLQQFETLYSATPKLSDAADAVATFLASLTTPNSRFDRYLNGDLQALSAEEQAGYALFKEVGCISCHNGRLLGGNLLEKARVYASSTPTMDLGLQDMGRYLATGDLADMHVLRVPSLRNVAVTPPYFHNGSVKNLDAAVIVMADALLGSRLALEDARKIAAFLLTLTGHHAGVTP